MPSNLLLLDEPTNHLDIPAREAIEAFMATSPATLLVVSHDRRLLETVCEKLWVVDEGAAVPFDGGYRAWRAAVADGWTVARALEVEAARLRGGSRRPAGHATPAPYGAAPDGRQVARPAAGGVRPAPHRAALHRPRARVKKEKLSKDAYRRQKAAVDAELTRLHLRKNHLELAMGGSGGVRELRGDAAGDERARGHRGRAGDGRGRLARARGAGAVTADRRRAAAPTRASGSA